MLLPVIHRFPSYDIFCKAVAERIAKEIASNTSEFRIVLSGGNTPQGVYEALAKDTALGKNPIPWNRVHLFWGDERCVPPHDRNSNFGMGKKTLLDKISIPEQNIHRIEGEKDPWEAAVKYSKIIDKISFDLVLLGIGEDGHTASLFPDSKWDEELDVVVTESPLPPYKRVTMTLKVIAQSKSVFMLVTGAGKARILAKVKKQIESGNPVLPAARVQQKTGEVEWFLDKASASELGLTVYTVG